MRLSLSILSILLLLELRLSGVDGFSISASSGRRTLRLSAEEAAGETPRTKPLSPEEIKAQVREKQGLPPDEEEAPKLFSEEVYTDIQQTLLLMEKRIKDGPGSLSILEVEEFSAQAQRIAVEMRGFEAKQVNELSRAGAPAMAALAAPAATPAAVAPPVAEMELVKAKEQVDTSLDEGPAYDGKGGMGLAGGTVNTYVIEGMESMSPEEYQKALQQSITDRQTVRRSSGKYGNRATWDYLNNLTGESGVLKDDEGGS